MPKVRKSPKRRSRPSASEKRRGAVDSALREIAATNRAVADQYGAVAVKWRHPKYLPEHQWQDGCPAHKELDGQYFLIKDTWATKKGSVKRGSNPYYDDIEQVGQRSGCLCWAEYVYDITELPEDMRRPVRRAQTKSQRPVPISPSQTDGSAAAPDSGILTALKAWLRRFR